MAAHAEDSLEAWGLKGAVSKALEDLLSQLGQAHAGKEKLLGAPSCEVQRRVGRGGLGPSLRKPPSTASVRAPAAAAARSVEEDLPEDETCARRGLQEEDEEAEEVLEEAPAALRSLEALHRDVYANYFGSILDPDSQSEPKQVGVQSRWRMIGSGAKPPMGTERRRCLPDDPPAEGGQLSSRRDGAVSPERLVPEDLRADYLAAPVTPLSADRLLRGFADARQTSQASSGVPVEPPASRCNWSRPRLQDVLRRKSETNAAELFSRHSRKGVSNGASPVRCVGPGLARKLFDVDPNVFERLGIVKEPKLATGLRPPEESPEPLSTTSARAEAVNYIQIPSNSFEEFRSYARGLRQELRRDTVSHNPFVQALCKHRLELGQDDLAAGGLQEEASVAQRLGTEREALSMLSPMSPRIESHPASPRTMCAGPEVLGGLLASKPEVCCTNGVSTEGGGFFSASGMHRAAWHRGVFANLAENQDTAFSQKGIGVPANATPPAAIRTPLSRGSETDRCVGTLPLTPRGSSPARSPVRRTSAWARRLEGSHLRHLQRPAPVTGDQEELTTQL
eukprot:TRINITY_DN23050_c0_g1_i1.p1 TRINITY_DN23050_c0_g1~~TRINITY_DN23050_c0_g1_i1.p1  ORF type:complete len:594 (+),score=116.35 TRINITY_DN23050_c0_g1_i1:88-1782(+)